MTEPKPEYDISESDVQDACVDLLRAAGWKVIVTSQDRRTRKQLRNLTDLIAVKHNCTLFIECKRPGGELIEGQEKFRDEILRHTGPNLHWWLIDDVEILKHALRLYNLL